MKIANPIYDSVFKYLLDDNQLAKLIISTIIGEEIAELTFRPQEQITQITERSLTVYRLDFAATIKNSSGEYRKVLIEIQKAKFDTDIMRFRRYLGNQYADPNNAVLVNDAKLALPIVTIYFLGYALEQTTAPVIRVARECWNLVTGEKLLNKEKFIESLTHDSYIIQIPYLHSARGSEIEELLKVFVQEKSKSIDKHILEINEEAIEKRYRPIVRRLQRAIADQQLLTAMEIEDDILEELQNIERKAERLLAEKEHERLAKERALADKEQALAEQERALADKEQERLAKERALSEKDLALAEKEHLLKLLREAGIHYQP